jgi:hypothetical protein
MSADKHTGLLLLLLLLLVVVVLLLVVVVVLILLPLEALKPRRAKSHTAIPSRIWCATPPV